MAFASSEGDVPSEWGDAHSGLAARHVQTEFEWFAGYHVSDTGYKLDAAPLEPV